MDNLKMQSPNLVDTNIDKIAALFPNCITEDRDDNGVVRRVVDFDLLRQELSSGLVEGPRERYTLNWPGKNEAILTANAPIAKTLRPCREESVDFDNTQNIYIEGDNLDALKLLQETYLNKVKMIYIDPPYNTGNDFIYEDDFAEDMEEFFQRSNQKDEQGNRLVANTESNGRFHSDWLSMIYSRLKLARNLLREDGVIFISIDENEVHNLRKLSDEIFGEDNFLSQIIIKVRHENRILKGDKDFHEVCEYCLAYKKGFAYKQTKRIEDNSSIEKYVYSIDLIGTPVDQIYLDGKYVEIFDPKSYKLVKHDLPSNDYLQSISIRGSLKEGNSSGRFYMKHLDKIEGKFGFLYKVPGMGSDKFDHRFFMRQPTENHANGIYFQGVPLDKKETKEVPYPNFYDFVNEFNNAGYEGGIEFRNGKKPIKFLHQMLTLGGVISDPNAIVMDFFSGSASTAEMVLRANSTDKGNRQFIMVQLPEAIENPNEFITIAEIGKERIRRAGKKIKEENPLTTQNLDTGFRVFKVDTSNMKDVYYTPDELKQNNLDLFTDHIKPDRSPDDLLFQVFIDWGLDLSLPIAKEIIDGKSVFFVDSNALVACFDLGITEELVKKLAAHKPLRVVFRDDGFGSDSVKINVEQVFKLLSPGTEVKSI